MKKVSPARAHQIGILEKPMGVQRIKSVFERTDVEKRAALITYHTLGYPNPEESLALAERAVEGGADILELGVPFSDPLADGPVIQRATHQALQNGITVYRCLEMARRLRERYESIPLIFMGYYNPILAYGEDEFCNACREVGVDGLIVPDLPPDEAQNLQAYCERKGLAMIYLLAPTSPSQRIQLVTRRSRGFVYLVSVTGTTGPRRRLPPDLTDFVQRVRSETDKPLAVGFGISSPEQATVVAAHADGVVVGSALMRLAEEPGNFSDLVAALRQALTQSSSPSS